MAQRGGGLMVRELTYSFYWLSCLSDERKKEINEWYISLTEMQRKMIYDLIWDAKEEERHGDDY